MKEPFIRTTVHQLPTSLRFRTISSHPATPCTSRTQPIFEPEGIPRLSNLSRFRWEDFSTASQGPREDMERTTKSQVKEWIQYISFVPRSVEISSVYRLQSSLHLELAKMLPDCRQLLPQCRISFRSKESSRAEEKERHWRRKYYQYRKGTWNQSSCSVYRWNQWNVSDNKGRHS